MESPRFKFFRPIFEKVCVCHTCWELKNFFWKSFETFLKMYWMESNFFFFFKKKGLRWKINCLVSLEELIRLNPKQIWCLRSPRESSSENVVIFYGKLKKKKYLLLVRLEIRRESDSFDRSGQIRIFSSFFFRRPITFIRGAYSFEANFPLLFFLSFLSFNNRNGRHPEINRIVGGEGCKNTRASFVTMV